MVPLCHCQSFLDTLVLCSHFLHFSGTWLLMSMTESGTPCASPCPLPYCNLDTSSRPTQSMSENLLCTQPPYTTNFRITLRCVSVHSSFIFLCNKACIGSSQIPSFNSSHSCFRCTLSPIDHSVSRKHFLHILREDQSHAHRFLSFKHQGATVAT